MQWYTVNLVTTVDAYSEVEVEATSEAEAKKAALNMIADDGVDIGMVVEVEDHNKDTHAWGASVME